MTAPLTREENRYLTVEEVAARFAVSVDSIYRWCRKGCFPLLVDTDYYSIPNYPVQSRTTPNTH